jgi:hypothetical protein
MPFIDGSALESHAEVVTLDHQRCNSKRDKKEPEHVTRVTDLIRHIRDEDLYNLIRRYIRIERPLPTEHPLIDPPKKVCTNPRKGFWEHTADLNGLAVIAAFQWKFTEKVTVFSSTENMPKNDRYRAVWFAKQAAIHEAKDSGYESRWLQLREQQWKRFDWLVGYLDRAVHRIAEEVVREEEISMEDLHLEHKLDSVITVTNPNQDKPEFISISGRADIVFDPQDGNRATIWEIKLVQSLKLQHVAQIVQYGLLWADSHPDAPFPRLLLFNVRDGERWEISTTKEEAREFVVGLLLAKRATVKLTDDEFRRQWEKTSAEAQSTANRIPPKTNNCSAHDSSNT